MFKFDFDVADLEGESQQNVVAGEDSAITRVPFGTIGMGIASEDELHEVPLVHLLQALPPVISCSPLTIPLASGSKLFLPRRDLFDARFQLISENTEKEEAGDIPVEQESLAQRNARGAGSLHFLDAPSDLVPGVYEGGLKTWECSVDLAAYLDNINDGGRDSKFSGKRILEIGCGTAVPSLYIIQSIFNSRINSQIGRRETQIHLQDYNRSVLELVTLPNIILSWYFSPASAEYACSLDVSAAQRSALPPRDPSRAHELPVTPALLRAFQASLRARALRVRFFYGPWDAFDMTRTGGAYDVVLSSETIYRRESLSALIALLQRACAPRAGLDNACLCLVAAKMLYFGVGGGVEDFARSVVARGGATEDVWTQTGGVARRIMQVSWAMEN